MSPRLRLLLTCALLILTALPAAHIYYRDWHFTFNKNAYEDLDAFDALREKVDELCRRKYLSIKLLDRLLVKSGGAQKSGPKKVVETTKSGKQATYNAVAYTYKYASGYVNVRVFFNDDETLFGCTVNSNWTTPIWISIEQFAQ